MKNSVKKQRQEELIKSTRDFDTQMKIYENEYKKLTLLAAHDKIAAYKLGVILENDIKVAGENYVCALLRSMKGFDDLYTKWKNDKTDINFLEYIRIRGLLENNSVASKVGIVTTIMAAAALVAFAVCTRCSTPIPAFINLASVVSFSALSGILLSDRVTKYKFGMKKTSNGLVHGQYEEKLQAVNKLKNDIIDQLKMSIDPKNPYFTRQEKQEFVKQYIEIKKFDKIFKQIKELPNESNKMLTKKEDINEEFAR